jgi:pimeloyl-ACP methyl ester carboxylesterase
MFARPSRLPRTVAELLLILCATSGMSPARAGDIPEPFPGQRTQWHGFDRFDFPVQVPGEEQPRGAIVVAPRTPAPGRPWLWWAEFFGHRPEPEIALLGRGFHVVHIKTPDLFGSPKAMAAWEVFYKQLVERHGLAKEAAYVGISRGGLYCYNWASLHPDRVACIYADGPVCDINTWPLPKGRGPGNPGEIPKLFAAYGVDSEEALLKVVLNPIDRLEPIAKSRIPLIHVYGDADTPVPWDQNTGVLAERYKALGGDITLIAKPGVGHVHGLDDSTPLVEFIDNHCQHQFSMTRTRGTDPVRLGSRRELFVDRHLIERIDGARFHMHEPRDEGVAVRMDKPWEGLYSGYSTVILDPAAHPASRYRMYYRGSPKGGLDGNPDERTCVAVSPDGLVWTKPELGLFEFAGSKSNNIVLANAAPASHNLCPMLDTRPGVPASERYKAIGGNVDTLYAYVSEDGFSWKKLQGEPILTKAHAPFPHVHLFDSQNLAFWSESEGQYVCYFRVWDGLRRIARTTSPDFREWTPAVLMGQIHDSEDGPRDAPKEHLYTNQTSPYFRAPHIYTAIAARFFEGRRVLNDAQAKEIGVDPSYFHDTSDAVLMSSRGGFVYDRLFLEGYLKPGIGARNWVSRTNYPALNVVPTTATHMALYVNQDYAQPTAHIRRYSLRTDGFASLRAGAEPGVVVTRRVTFEGSRLRINFSTSAGGGVRVGLLDEEGNDIPGFGASDCVEQIGNEIERIVGWKSGADVSPLAGKVVRLRIELRDADLYSFVFGG